MKKIMVLLLILTFYAANAFASQLYVKSMRAKVLSKPSFRSKIVAVAKRGAIVEEIKRRGKWIEVKYKGRKGWKKGWVSKYLVSTKRPMKRVSLIITCKGKRKIRNGRNNGFTV